MLRVLIVGANQERMPDPIPPIGAAYIAAAARRAGHVARIYDACFAKDRYAEELAAAIAEFRPDVIGLSIRNVDNVAFPQVTCYLNRYQRIATACRASAPKAVLIVGGSAFSLFPEEFLRTLDVDYGVAGEGENVFVQMLDEIDRHGKLISGQADEHGLVRPKNVADLDAGVQPAHDLLDVQRYFAEGGSVNVQTKRGCGFKCIYCTYPVLEGNTVRTRDPEQVVDEIEGFQRAHGVDFFFFVDNVFNHPEWHVRAICEAILRRGLRIRWTAYVSPAGCTRELFELMQRAGCQSMDFGSDCFSDAQLVRMGKSFDSAQIFAVTEWCHQLGIRFNHSLILGGPGETWSTVEETVANTVKSRANAVIAVIGVRLYRDTPIARLAIQQGLCTREQIGITPIFFLSDEIRDGILEFMGSLATKYRNWIVPGLKKGMNERFFTRVRARGVKGPLWQLLDPIEYEGIPDHAPAGPRGSTVAERNGVFLCAGEQVPEPETP